MKRRYYIFFLSIVLALFTCNAKKGTTLRIWDGDAPMCVYLPEKYFLTITSYPVLYLLPGTGDSDLAWFEEGNLSTIVDELTTQGAIREMIIVMPQIPTDVNSDFIENFDNTISFIEKNFRVLKNKKNRAIAGLSIGGFYAMHISHYFPQKFNYVGLFSAIYTTKKKEIFKNSEKFLFGISKNTPIVYANTEKEHKKQFRYPPELYYIAIGKNDFLYKQNILFRKYLDKHKYQYVYHESNGGHNWKNWQEYITLFLPLLFHN